MNETGIKGYRLIFGYLGLFMMMIGLIVLLPVIMVIFDAGEASEAGYFIIPGALAIIIGYLLHNMIRGKTLARLERHQDAILIVMIWVTAILFASVPFMLTGIYGFTQSVFESTSGFSTTGLTVVDVTVTSKTFLLFRSIMQFFGGVGLVLVLTSAVSDRYGMRLYHAEGHYDKLLPNLLRAARLILSLYLGYIILGTTLLSAFGMSLFDAFNHAIASVSTGGFSTQVASIGHYDSVAIETVTMALMILGSTNLVLHLLLFKGKLRKFAHHAELKLFLFFILFLMPLMVLSFGQATGSSFGTALRHGLFQFMSAITTTGFQTVASFHGLPAFFIVGVIICMIIGGGIGSTAGGIKQFRVALSLKHIWWNIRNRLSNKKTLHTDFIARYGKDIEVTQNDLLANNAHIALYILTLIIGTTIVSAYGYPLTEALFEFASALGTVGLSIGIVGFDTPPLMLWTFTFGMFLGRLEFFVVFIAIAKLIFDARGKKVL